MAAKGRLLELIAANCPVFYLHPADTYMPTTVEHFSAHDRHTPSKPFIPCTFSPRYWTAETCSAWSSIDNLHGDVSYVLVLQKADMIEVQVQHVCSQAL